MVSKHSCSTNFLNISHSAVVVLGRAEQLSYTGLAKPEELQAKVQAVEGEFGIKCGHSDANVMKPAEIRWPACCLLIHKTEPATAICDATAKLHA